MKVQLNEKETAYINFFVNRHRKGKPTTQCLIGVGADCFIGKARCHRRDRYDKAIGKAKALSRAMEQAWPGAENRGLRLVVWRAFEAHFSECPDMARLVCLARRR
jgi:hypothetical protein